MSSEPKPPSFRAILFGIVVTIIAVVFMCALGDVLKVVGSPFLFIPGALGLIQTIGPEDVRTVAMSDSPTIVRVRQPGLYAVYVDEVDLLTITDALINSHGAPWLKVKAVDTGESIGVAFIERGLRVYDTPYAKGRPIMSFAVARPGAYELTYPRRGTDLSIVPDYTTGHETLLTLIYLVQISLLVGVVVVVWRRRHHTERAAAKALQDAAIARADAFWKKHADQQRAPQDKRDKQ